MEDIPKAIANRPVRFMDKLRARMREQGLAYSTEKTYLHWIHSFIRFHRMRHPHDMGSAEVDAFLSWLAVHRHVAPATQAIVLNALVFLYQRFYEKDLGALTFKRACPKRRVPQVLSHREATDIIDQIKLPIRSDTVSRRACSKKATTCARSRNCSGIPTFRLRRSIPMS